MIALAWVLYAAAVLFLLGLCAIAGWPEPGTRSTSRNAVLTLPQPTSPSTDNLDTAA
jgi:hypothetical protein